MKIWLDDERDPMCHLPTLARSAEWRWIKTAEELIETLSALPSMAVVREMSLDHDLGEGIMTGYDAVTWIEARVVGEGQPAPGIIFVHSQNPVGRKRMLQVIRNIRRAGEGRL